MPPGQFRSKAMNEENCADSVEWMFARQTLGRSCGVVGADLARPESENEASQEGVRNKIEREQKCCPSVPNPTESIKSETKQMP